SQLTAPVEVMAILANGKTQTIGHILPADYDVLTRLKTNLTNVKTIRLQSDATFNIREIAALATAAKEFITIDLLQPKIIGWIETRHWAGEGTATATELLLSADNKKWYKVADLNPSSLQTIVTKVAPPVKARYIKVAHTLVENDWNKVFLWKINAYDQNGPFGQMPIAQKNKHSFRELLGVNAIWGWGHKSYAGLLKENEGPGLYNSIASHARNYHFIKWEVTDPDHTPDYKAMAEGKGMEAQAWLDWDREYKVWQAKDLRVHAAVKFGEIDANKWDRPYESAYKYAYAFAEHFGPTHGNGLVDVMEIGNEPWYYEADLYKNILLGMAKGAKAADPKMFVLPCALQSAFPQNENEGLFKNYMGARITPQIAPYLDGINVHYYSWTHRADGTRIAVHPEDPASDMRGILNDIRFRNKNMPDKPIYVTEWGWDSDGGGEDCTHSECVSEQAQAIYAIRALLMYARLGVDGMTWFFYANEGPNSSLFTRSGLTSSPSKGFQKKKSYYALQSFIKTLGDKHFLKVIKEDQQGWVYLLGDKKGKPTHLVAWKAVSEKDKKSYEISIPYKKEIKSIMNLDGAINEAPKATNLKPRNGQLRIRISAIPVVLTIE
ncbi:MAG TPA: discoidin domain-containing protein, partial [Saprospiraceae bacterium]|nr:discoidin domain-containing protein [Saprospiraceae bacterium]